MQNTHEVAQALAAEAKVVYVDYDYYLRTLTEFDVCFESLELIDPDLVPINSRRPGLPRAGNTEPLGDGRVGVGS